MTTTTPEILTDRMRERLRQSMRAQLGGEAA
jgi:hypothetical protein